MWGQMVGLLDFVAGPHYHPVRTLHRKSASGSRQGLTALGGLVQGAGSLRAQLDDPKDPMRSTTVKVLVLLFAGLVVACPFGGSGASHSHASSLPEDGTFCGILHSSIAAPVLLEQSALLLPSEEPVVSVPKGYPLWCLAHSIDHPPERSA